MQTAAGGCTGSGDIATVLGDLRVHQYDIQQETHLKTAGFALCALAFLLYAKVSTKSTQKLRFLQLFHSV
jgi:hypothetical protein